MSKVKELSIDQLPNFLEGTLGPLPIDAESVAKQIAILSGKPATKELTQAMQDNLKRVYSLTQ